MKRKMKLKLTLRSFAAATLFLFISGCGVTQTMELPCPESAFQPFPDWLLGDWMVLKDKDESQMLLTIAAIPDQPDSALVEFTCKDKKWPPIYAGVFLCGEKRFCAVTLATDKLLESGGYHDGAIFLMRPVFQVLELTGTEEAPILHMVSFAKDSNGEFTLIGKNARLSSSGLLLNSTEEIQTMLVKGEYITKAPHRLTRLPKP